MTMAQSALTHLTERQNRHIAKLDRDKNWTIEKQKFNARLIALLHRMDRGGDGVLQGKKLIGQRDGGKHDQHGDEASDPTENS